MISDSIVTSGTSFTAPNSNPSTIKFSLFVKIQEIKQIAEALEQVMLMPKKERAAWVTDHQDMMTDLMDSFVSDSVLALDGLQLDAEAMKLSVDFITNLRDAMNTIQGILRDHGKLDT